MAPRTLLESTELLAVEECLNRGELEQAQQRLARLSQDSQPAALNYLATRLLYLRDRLDPGSVAERMRELLHSEPDFPEARTLLHTAAGGIRGPDSMPANTRASLPPTARSLRSPAAPPEERTQAVSSRPTARPAVWPPPELQSVLDAEEGNERPTANPELPREHEPDLTRAEASRRIVVDTRLGYGPPPSANSPVAWAAARPRMEGTYTLNTSTSPRTDTVATQAPTPPRSGRSLRPGRKPSDPPLRAPSPPSGLRASSSAPRSLNELLPAGELWPGVEQAIGRGEHDSASEYFEDAARRQLSHLPPVASDREPELLAQLAAELLNKSYVTQHFAPFDLSLQSLSRLQVAVSTLLGMTPNPQPASALVLLLGSYAGETLRTSHRGSWHNASGALERASVRAGNVEWYPFSSLRTWLNGGGRSSLLGEFANGMAKPGSQAWRSQRPVRVPPHALWQGDASAADVPALARAVCDSVFSTACGLLRLQRLDLSLESLRALDWLCNLLIDSPVPLTGQEPWLQRNALLLGAYAGEVLRQHAPAQWVDTSATAAHERLNLQLHSGLLVSPITTLLSCAVQQRSSNLENMIMGLLVNPTAQRA